MFSVIKHIKIWFIVSSLLVLGSAVLLFSWGLKPGVDFKGGSLSELEFENRVDTGAVRQELQSQGFRDVIIQPVNERRMLIKTEPLTREKLQDFKKIIGEKFGQTQELRFESIGPTISKELVRKAYWQIVLVCLGILFYVAYAFRKVKEVARKSGLSSWRLGAAAIVALIHDLAITIGVFVILGKYRGVEIDPLFVTALLTILGFSVHDTIVVFDRIRENLQIHSHKSLQTIIDYSVNSTLARSINTSSTLVFVLVAMLFFGGQTIFNFVLALLVGVIIGTYSSIFIASPLLYIWSKKEAKT